MSSGVHALLVDANETLVDAVYQAHPVVADADLPLAAKLLHLPHAADAAALRGCLRPSNAGPCLTLRPPAAELRARVAAAAMQVPELRAVSLHIRGDHAGDLRPDLAAAADLLRQLSAVRAIAVLDVSIDDYTEYNNAADGEARRQDVCQHVSRLFAQAPTSRHVYLPQLCIASEARAAACLGPQTALRRLTVAVPFDQSGGRSSSDQAAPSLTMFCTALRHLDVTNVHVPEEARNEFVSALARQLRSLPHLRHFAARSLSLAGAHVLQLLSPADSMPQLRHLDLSGNCFNIDAENVRAISASTGLRDLRLADCRGRSGDGELECVRCVATGAFAQMQHLALSLTCACIAFVASLAKLTRLSALLLGSPSWRHASAAAVARTFAALPRLRAFQSQDLETHPQLPHHSVSRLRSLTVVQFERVSFVSQALACASRLQRLELGRCTIWKYAVLSPELMSSVAALTELTALTLAPHLCNMHNAPAVCAMLAALPALVQVETCFEEFTQAVLAEVLSTLPTSLACLRLSVQPISTFPTIRARQLAEVLALVLPRLERLNTLELDGRGVGGSHAATFASAIGGLARLRRLELRAFQVPARAARALVPHLARLQWLTHLAIRNTGVRLDDNGACALAALIPRLPRLQCLDLRLQGQTGLPNYMSSESPSCNVSAELRTMLHRRVAAVLRSA